jgi:hypothetical protein
MPPFLLPILGMITGGVSRVPTWMWKYISIGLVIGVVFLYGYNKGKGVERARCEAAAKIAQNAADAQDLQAEREGRQQDLQITDALTQQKKVDDAKIAALEKQLSQPRPKGAGNPCVYDKSTADPDDAPRRLRK